MATVNDLVLIHLEDEPVSFARVENIQPDAKKDWYHITLLMLQIPVQTVTWILKDQYINGEEFFMNGKRMKLEKVKTPGQDLSATAPVEEKVFPEDSKERKKQDKKDNVISFASFKKNP